MPATPIPQLTALLLLPALAAAAARRPAWGRAVSALALIGSAVALILLPANSAISGIAGISGFGKGAAWLALLGVALVVFALPARPDAGGTRAAWIIHLLALGTVLATRSPMVLLLVLLMIAAAVPRLDPAASADGWRRSLAVGGLLVFAGLLIAGAGPTPVTDLTLAGGLVLGFLLVTGAFPFGLGLWRWLTEAGPRRATAVAAGLVPALMTTLVDNLDVLNRLQLVQPTRVPVAIALFGAVTLLLSALHSFAVRGWHSLGADGVLFDLGLALVAAGAGGLDGAALALTVMSLTRPLMFLVERLQMRRAWGWIGAAGALLGAAGMPPTLGFAARLLVLAAAFRLSLPLGLAVLAGVMLQLVASARVVLARLGDAARPAAAHHPRISERIAIALVVVALVAGGIAPGVVLSRVWGIG
ncbi:MAG TPA: hypothetical protein VG329_02535 [Candidatus Dormibacteraeota bacterium]|jgi:hypothetical protein|nr:hypothetical protein [Candidatus Dormibacteraeota bacterium]